MGFIKHDKKKAVIGIIGHPERFSGVNARFDVS